MLEEKCLPHGIKYGAYFLTLKRALILARNEIYQKYGATPEAFDLVVKVCTLFTALHLDVSVFEPV
jgi:hypothetical protein